MTHIVLAAAPAIAALGPGVTRAPLRNFLRADSEAYIILARVCMQYAVSVGKNRNMKLC